MINLNQALYYLLIIETDEIEINKIKLNDLSILIFGQIIKPLSKEILKEELKRIIIIKKHFLKPEYEIVLDKSISEKISLNSIGKELMFNITETNDEIIINAITEKNKITNYLKEKITLLK